MFANDEETMTADTTILYTARRTSKEAQLAVGKHWRWCSQNHRPFIVVSRGKSHACIEYDWYTMPLEDCENIRSKLFFEQLSEEVTRLIDAHASRVAESQDDSYLRLDLRRICQDSAGAGGTLY